MRSLIAVLIAAAAGSVCVVGCGSDSDTGGSVSTTQCVGAYTDLTQTEFSAKADTKLGCASDDDLSNSCLNDLQSIAGGCGKGCLNQAVGSAADKCVAECLTNNLPKAFSDSCMSCYTADVACARELCIGPCFMPTSDACAACRVEKGCAPTFYACSGLPVPTGLDLGGGEGGGANDGASAGAGGSPAAETPAAGAGGS